MGEDHSLDEADPSRDGRGHEIGDCRTDVGCEEQAAERAFGNGEFAREEICDPCQGDEARGQRVDGEEETDFEEYDARGGGDGRPDGLWK